MKISINVVARGVLLLGWVLLASAALVPPSVEIPIAVEVQVAVFAVLVVMLVAVAVFEPQEFTWQVTMSMPLRICFLLMVVASSSFRGRMAHEAFVLYFVLSIAAGALLGVLMRERRSVSRA